MIRRAISGSAVALVTPFKSDGALDTEALRRLVEFHIQGGTDILIPCGTTGESPTLSDDEQYRIISLCVEFSNGKIRVMAGAGSNNTAHAVHLAKAAQKAGATGILSVAPYYNKPTQEGFFRHYAALAEAVSVPVIIYNVPGRTGANISVETMLRLASSFPNILAVKEASGNMAQIEELLRNRPAQLSVMSGDDYLTLPMMALGGDGVISVAANQIPQAMKHLVEAMFQSNLAEAQRLHNKYLNLMNLNFLESNPIPVKYTLAQMGLIELSYRLPMVPPSPATREKLDAELKRLGLIKGELATA
ncbi:MAG: 4-hydroxy-tetrahydrodipicolinate synthase [Candidatus Thermochlorobacter sp.]